MKPAAVEVGAGSGNKVDKRDDNVESDDNDDLFKDAGSAVSFENWVEKNKTRFI